MLAWRLDSSKASLILLLYALKFFRKLRYWSWSQALSNLSLLRAGFLNLGIRGVACKNAFIRLETVFRVSGASLDLFPRSL